jgi:site-specific DNA recombinase
MSTSRNMQMRKFIGWLLAVAIAWPRDCGVSCEDAAPSKLLPNVPMGVYGSRVRRKEGDDHPDDPTSESGNASYTRYSSDLQSERSIPDQQRKCCDAAARYGLEITSELEFVDEAISGAKHDRAGFEALMTAARAGRIKTLFFENLSRLARDCVLTLTTLRELVHVLKIRVISVDEGIDGDNDSWELLAAILGMQNEQYLRALAKFVFRGQEGVVLGGLCVGDYCFGFTSEPIPDNEQQRRGRNPQPKKRYVIDAEKAAWVVLIFHWFVVEKRSLNWIAKELTRLKAPKDHRATKKNWRHQQLTGLLSNRKYIGDWSWGKNKNVRNPMTGKIRQERRSPAETEKWRRQLPELRIIDDETFEKAQERLRQSKEAMAACRKKAASKSGQSKTQLAGSRSKSAETWPRHLLSGLVECGACGRNYHVSGANSRYMHCANYLEGACDCKTTLRRDLAEEMILAAIGSEIFGDATLRAVVFDAAQEAWRRAEETLPSELATAEKSLVDLDRRIERLTTQCEEQDVPELAERLRRRCDERAALRSKLQRLRSVDQRRKSPPTQEWIASQFSNLREILSGAGPAKSPPAADETAEEQPAQTQPAAGLALRSLLDGRIVVTEIRHPGKQRHYLQGRFCVKLYDLVHAAEVSVDESTMAGREAIVKEIVIDFRRVERHVELANEIKAYLDGGNKSVDEVLAKFGISYTLYTKAVDYWYVVRGLERPDFRSQRSRLKGRRTSDKLGGEIMTLWHEQELTVQEIAAKLECGLESVREAVVDWHVERGLPIPDGRARRKEIRLKKVRGGGLDAA